MVVVAACGASSARAEWRQNSTGTFSWWDESGNSTGQTITADAFNQMRDANVASGQEMFSATVPSDISTADAQAGVSAWDFLSTGSNTVKVAGIEAMGAEGAWAGLGAAMPAFALGAGTFYTGWQIGSAIATFLGIDSGTSTDFTGAGGISVTPHSGSPLQLYPRGTDVSTIGGGCDTSSDCTVIHTKLKVATFALQWSTGTFGVNEVTDPTRDSGACDYRVSQRPSGGTWVETAHSDVPPNTACTTLLPDSTNPGCTNCWSAKVYLIPATVVGVPGPGQSNWPETQTVTTTYTGPNEQGKKNGATNMLTDPSFNDWQRWFCSKNPSYCGGQLPPASGGATVTIPAITTNETFQQFKNALIQAGLTGSVTLNVLSDVAANPMVAPDDVVSSDPAPGTQVDPSTAVQVNVNPATSTVTGETPPSAPTLPGITIPSAPTPCDVFPFGIPCWLKSQLDKINGGAQAPQFDIGVPDALCASGGGCKLHVDLAHPFGVDLGGVVAVVRPILLVVSFVGLVIWLGGIAMGGSTGSGASGGAEAED